MANLENLRGVIVPLVTPLTHDERVDEASLRKLVEHVLTENDEAAQEIFVSGIFVNSTTGEGLALLEEEQDRALQIVLDQARGRAAVLAGVSDTSTKRALKKLDQIASVGADVAVAHPPFYYPSNDQTELVSYYSELAKHALGCLSKSVFSLCD